MSCLPAPCWGDALRTTKLRKGLQQTQTQTQAQSEPPQLKQDLAHCVFPSLPKKDKDSDASSGGRTSCTSSHDVWDDDDVSTDGSSGSSAHSDDDASDPRSRNRERSASPVGLRSEEPTETSAAPSLDLNGCWPKRQSAWTTAEIQKQQKQKQKQQQPSQPSQPPLPSGSPPRRKSKKQAGRGSRGTCSAPFGPQRAVIPMVRAIDIGAPGEYDLRGTNGLMKCVNALAPQPTPEELGVKHLAISELQRVMDIWLRRTLQEQDGDCDSETTDVTATLLLGGSWHLKVGCADSDLDIVALMPHTVTAELFFSSLCDYLDHEDTVTKLVARRKAAVPVLSFQLSGVRFDLLFARYAQTNDVPKHLPFLPGGDLQVLRGMDATSVSSLGVPRVASFILELVPNASVFRSCLRVVRLWAQRRGLYSNKAGYLGGISWALLVCFVCQMFPRATVAALVHRFFSVLASWQWPTPILVAQPTGDVEGVGISCTQWSPQQNRHDRAHLMPIITPGFPAVNTAVNVNMSTLRVLHEEFVRGQHILDDLRHRGLSSPSSWNQLFAPTEVLVRYDHHLAIELKAESEESLAEWASFVGSRTRKLVETLQHTPSVASIHPLPELVRPRRSAEAETDTEVVGYYFIGYSVDAPPLPPTPPRYTHLKTSKAGPPSPPKATLNGSANDGETNLARSCVASAARYFLATELNSASEKKAGMKADIAYRAWSELPDSIFAGGRSAAAGNRARYIMTQAHNVNLAMGLGR